jgi:hypothetical protein
MDLRWPTSDGAVLLWAEIVLAWTCCVYLFLGNQPIIEEMGGTVRATLPRNWRLISMLRAIATGLSVFLVTTWAGWKTFALIGVLSLLALALPFLRVALAERSKPWGAELELSANLLAVGLSALLIGDPQSAPLRGLLHVPVSSDHLSAIMVVSAILLFITSGGTHLVRGVLARVDAVPLQAKPPAGDRSAGGAPGSAGPPASPSHTPSSQTAAPGVPIAMAVSPSQTTHGRGDVQQLDIKEYNRGRVVGIIERIIMTVVVAVGAYSALMFLIGAKGLIRSKELEKHEFAEYFLIGTLASAATAILCGLLIRALVHTLW